MLFAGLDFDRLLLGDGLWVRHERVFGFDIDVFTDKNLKPDPTEKKHSSAQTDVQSIEFPFGIDTVSVIDGEVVYHELEVGKPEPGGVSFTAITATITGFTSRGVAGRSPPLRIETHSTLFGMGKLDAYATVPLTAAGFDVTYHGRLGPMPAVAINQFAEKSLPVTIEGGQFEEVTFSVRSVNGHAVGNITPVYKDLRVRVHDKKAGFFKRAEYSLVTFLAKEFFIRHDNPAKAGHPPRVGAIDHTFAGEIDRPVPVVCGAGRDREVDPEVGKTADREGFEPSKPLPVYRFSRPAPSATRTPVQSRSEKVTTALLAAKRARERVEEFSLAAHQVAQQGRQHDGKPLRPRQHREVPPEDPGRVAGGLPVHGEAVARAPLAAEPPLPPSACPRCRSGPRTGPRRWAGRRRAAAAAGGVPAGA